MYVIIQRSKENRALTLNADSASNLVFTLQTTQKLMTVKKF